MFPRFAQGSTHTFDAATFELWGALAHGARVVGIPKDAMISPPDLAARLQGEGISVLYLTAALFTQTASQVPDAFRSLRRLLVGGEVVDAGFFRRVLESGPSRRTSDNKWPDRRHCKSQPESTCCLCSWHCWRSHSGTAPPTDSYNRSASSLAKILHSRPDPSSGRLRTKLR